MKGRNSFVDPLEQDVSIARMPQCDFRVLNSVIVATKSILMVSGSPREFVVIMVTTECCALSKNSIEIGATKKINPADGTL